MVVHSKNSRYYLSPWPKVDYAPERRKLYIDQGIFRLLIWSVTITVIVHLNVHNLQEITKQRNYARPKLSSSDSFPFTFPCKHCVIPSSSPPVGQWLYVFMMIIFIK